VLLRTDERGVLAIAQPSHAWISGQLARAWGNARFGALEPYEEVCLAAEQHDIGMAAWDMDPERNPRTGLPYSFLEMSIPSHLEVWSGAPRRVLPQSRYAALLVSMHGRRLYERRDLAALSAQDADAVRAYLLAQRDFQEQMLASLRADPLAADFATPERVARNSQLVWTWDSLSLAVCLDWDPWVLQQVPAVAGPLDLELRRDQETEGLTIDPWPFTHSTVTMRCDGRRLIGRSETDDELREALVGARWETIAFRLREPQSPGLAIR
jgi:hypothetical protein